ncbi:MAG: peptide deformylase [Clostridia bacterium]|nr:peptide deformylase [Clostridia bacterium]
MAIRNVVKEGDPILRRVCKEIPEVSPRYREMLDDMLETMRYYNGVGIAGPQIGVMRRLFVAEPEPGKVYYMINPKITHTEGEQIDTEGCLSIPGYIGTVTRPSKIKMTAWDVNGEEHEYTFEGFYARVMCHEYDHLEGRLYTDIAENVHLPEDDEFEEEFDD